MVVDRETIAALQDWGAIDRAEIANLRQALVSVRRFGAAVGIAVATLKVTEDAAFAVLQTESQNTNRKLRDVADDVLHTGVVDS